MRTSTILAAALLPLTSAVFTVIRPGGPNQWWIANDQNTLQWSSVDYPTFVPWLSNPDINLLTSDAALSAVTQSYMYSLTVPGAPWNPGPNYVVKLCDPVNMTNVYATSQPFEIRAKGQPYPSILPSSVTSSAAGTPTAAGGASGAAGAASGTDAKGSTATQSTTSTSGAMDLAAPVAAAAVGGVLAAAAGLF